MDLSNKIEIYLITYNRKDYLEKTLKQILGENSPIKNFSITILDNASTDGTSELVKNYCNKFRNLHHIRHCINIGGDANICRAFELGAISKKEYIWVLCDDDKYDFNNWEEVEKEIQKGTDIICCADYVIPDTNSKQKKEYQIFQLTFVPAGIYKANLITNNVLINMYNAIYTLFQQSCITISAINHNKKIHVLSKPIVFNGIYYKDASKDISYTRGYEKQEILKRRQDTLWILGYCNILSLLRDKSLAKKCLEVAIPNKDIYGSWNNFYHCVYKDFLKNNKLNYFLEILQLLPDKHRKEILNIQSLNIQNAIKKEGIFIPRKNEYARRCKKLIEKIFSISDSPDGEHTSIFCLGIKLSIKKN